VCASLEPLTGGVGATSPGLYGFANEKGNVEFTLDGVRGKMDEILEALLWRWRMNFVALGLSL